MYDDLDKIEKVLKGISEKKGVLQKIEKSLQNIIYKAGLPTGTVRDWKDGKYKKLANGEWERIDSGKKDDDNDLDFPEEGAEEQKEKKSEKKENIDNNKLSDIELQFIHSTPAKITGINLNNEINETFTEKEDDGEITTYKVRYLLKRTLDYYIKINGNKMYGNEDIVKKWKEKGKKIYSEQPKAYPVFEKEEILLDSSKKQKHVYMWKEIDIPKNLSNENKEKLIKKLNFLDVNNQIKDEVD